MPVLALGDNEVGRDFGGRCPWMIKLLLFLRSAVFTELLTSGAGNMLGPRVEGGPGQFGVNFSSSR